VTEGDADATSATIAVTVRGDTRAERNEKLSLIAADVAATGTIIDDDRPSSRAVAVDD
jgi:hypothetical protein